jgi:hypothetical protein
MVGCRDGLAYPFLSCVESCKNEIILGATHPTKNNSALGGLKKPVPKKINITLTTSIPRINNLIQLTNKKPCEYLCKAEIQSCDFILIYGIIANLIIKSDFV